MTRGYRDSSARGRNRTLSAFVDGDGGPLADFLEDDDGEDRGDDD
jgi:hypothetical protein